jgi:hypothetical protein
MMPICRRCLGAWLAGKIAAPSEIFAADVDLLLPRSLCHQSEVAIDAACRPNSVNRREKMRFMIIRKADTETEANVMPTQELLAEMGSYMESMVKAGVMLAGDGLASSAKGARVKFHGGKPMIIDGPFSETKELVAGFSIIQVGSRQEAIDWVKKWPQIDGHGEVEIEIRQILEADDFGEAFTADMRAMEDRMRAEGAALAKK